MKKLTKALLINWLYYDKLVLDFSDINYIVGKNASGKSTFLDAIMMVLLGEVSSRNFNKAANESSQRTLKRYLRADMDPNNPKARKGRSFNTYIACEFLDDVLGKSFTTGIVFDCYADGSERYNFFIYDDKIPGNCFIIDRKPMDISELRVYFRETYKSRQEIYDSNKKYRSAIKAKWNIHVDQVFSVLKQGAFFKPINDIRDFITNNVCDVHEKPDIVSMQQNIQDYKHQEKLAQRQEERLGHLQDIHELHRRHLRAQELLDVHEFLKSKAEAELERAFVSKCETELASCKLELESLEAEGKRLNSDADDLKERRDRIMTSEPFKEYERLETDKSRLSVERKNLQNFMEKTAVNIRTETFQWLKYCEKTETAPWVKEVAVAKLANDIPALRDALVGLERLKPDDFGNMDLSVFKRTHGALNHHSELLRESCYEMERDLARYKSELDECALSLKELEKGNKNYPDAFLNFRAALAKRLLSDIGVEIPLHPLADLLEITDPTWRKAVEGYLNTQRFLLIIDPQYYLDALRAYNKIKRDFPGYGLVDVAKVKQRNNIQRLPNSLATKVAPTSELVKEYIDFLLGRVVCCETVEDLRRYSTAITADGMLYQGYVARAIHKDLLDSAYIGKSALEQQIRVKKERVRELTVQSESLQFAYSDLEQQKKKEIMLTGYYIEETIAQMTKNHARCLTISDELSKLSDRLDELNRGGLLGIANQKAEVDSLIESNQADRLKCAQDERSRKDRIKTLTYDILPPQLPICLCQQ